MVHHVLPPRKQDHQYPTPVVSWLQSLDALVRGAEEDHAQQVALHVGQRLHDHLSTAPVDVQQRMVGWLKNGNLKNNSKSIDLKHSKHQIYGNLIQVLKY